MGYYSCDFETTTKRDDCRVWAWCYSDIDTPEDTHIGLDIDSFMFNLTDDGGIYYFHNLKFDGNFILYWLFISGYHWVTSMVPYGKYKKKRSLRPGEFTTCISDMGTWYTMNVQLKPDEFGVSNSIEFRDSAKLIPLAVEEIPKAYGLEESKGEIDYTKDRPKGYQPDANEIEYIRHDVIIVAKAIKFMREQNQTKLTAAANALSDFQSRFDKKTYNKLFPKMTEMADADIRKSYKGGWTYLNPKYKNVDVEDGIVFDVNSMYPWAMKYCLLPYGKPYAFTGKYEPNANYPLYVINIEADFKLKEGKYPSIQLKNTGIFMDNEYIEYSIKPMALTLTNVDYELFIHNYDVTIYQWHGGYMFKGKVGMFSEYINYWYGVKTESKKTKNKGMEKIAKLMLNSLYGKFGARTHGKSKIPYYDPDLDKVRYKMSEEETRKGVYLPIATFITSYCRDKIIRCAELCGDRFCYADTDSVHIVGTDPVPGMDVDDFRLGAFKEEERFIRARFIRQKTYMEVYIEDEKEKLNIKCCGMPRKMQATVTEGDFYEGAEFDASKNSRFEPKLMPRIVPGGVILEETTFKIKKPRTAERLRVV